MDQSPALLVVAPLLAACFIAAAGWFRRSLCFPLAVAGLAVALFSSVATALRVLGQGPFIYRMAGWDPPWGISYAIDYLNAPVLVVVAAVALLNLISSRRIIEEEQAEKAFAFHALYLLSVTGLLGMTATGDAFNLYVLLEISSLTGYALVARGDDRAALAGLNYVLLGTIGASFYLLGVGFLYMLTGSLNMVDLGRLLPDLYGSPALLAGFLLIMVGVWTKAALFPLHAWLPGAYTHANNASSSLLAPLMTKVMIYVMLRMMLTVFTPDYVFSQLALEGIVVVLATVAIVAGALMSLAQKDLKKMAAYIIVSEVGYMVGGAWLGNRAGLTGATLHVLNDALMTLCIFMVVANVTWRIKSYAFKDLRGLFAKMPFTMMAFVAGGMSIIGVPPACGFFSKWYLIRGGLEAGRYEFVIALLLSSLVNVVLFFRVFEYAFFPEGDTDAHGHAQGTPHGHVEDHAVAIEEAPLSMVVPLWVVAAGLIVVGLYTGVIVRLFIDPALPAPL
ncbi:MAG: complex I subunit 5 family protein [Desulfatibacillaceae bacterium]